jgi:hypothetical protein
LVITRDERFWLGGTKTLTTKDDKATHDAIIYDPYPEYNTGNWKKQWMGDFHACVGPSGADLDKQRAQDMMSVYRGSQKGKEQIAPRPQAVPVQVPQLVRQLGVRSAAWADM